jgi:hypothetical protein
MEVSDIVEVAEVRLPEANKHLKAGWVYLNSLVILTKITDSKFTEPAVYVLGRPKTVKP